MKIRYNGKDMDLQFNENGSMFYVTNKHGDVVDWLCSRHEKPGFNQCWLDSRLVHQLETLNVVKRVDSVEPLPDPNIFQIVLCDIIHPSFNDGGYSPFGDFCRSRLGQQCQYGSRYISGRLEGYPALGEGLRFNNGHDYRGGVRPLDASDYHAVRIHRDDMDEFERRYKAYCEERLR